MRIAGEWLKAGRTQRVMRLLEGGGHRALAVGGCVRDAALARPVTDIDIATDARPERVIALAEAAGLRAVPTGVEHGTVTLVADGAPFEVTTFRRDVATDGRHAVVAFSDDVAEDAARRDFTLNALYADREGRVTDPLGGWPDLLRRHVRFIGDPAARIREDYLRILRFFRFTAQLGDPELGLDAEGLAACAAAADGLDRLSRERVGHETRRLLGAPAPGACVAAMDAAGVLDRALPRADAARLDALLAAEGPAPPDWLRRLAALGAGGEAEALRLSRAEARALAALREAAGGGEGAFALGHRLGAARGRDALLLRGPLPPGAEAALEAGARAEFPLTAGDLMPALTGPALGDALARARAAWAAAEGRPDAAALRRVALASIPGADRAAPD